MKSAFVHFLVTLLVAQILFVGIVAASQPSKWYGMGITTSVFVLIVVLFVVRWRRS